ncbi:MAG: BioY family transporter [Spirochaetaceae bacterium 4572_59]|nr:MAG: BioY family transporter [Spirochaetaceae bacterium 4572_59]
MNKIQIRRTVLTAVFTALIAAGAYAAVPIGPVPIVLTTMFVLLSGLLGGFRIGLYSSAAYLLLGVLGLPVFAGGAGGFAVLLGPTGGYLFGYLPAASAAGLIYRPAEGSALPLRILQAATAVLVGSILIYLPGVPWLKISLGMEWSRAIQAGMIPFIPGDLLKAVAAATLAVSLKDRFQDFLKDE